MSNSRFAGDFAVAGLPLLHDYLAANLAYIPRGGTAIGINGLLGPISSRIVDSDGHRRDRAERVLRLFTNPSGINYSGIENVVETAAIGEFDDATFGPTVNFAAETGQLFATENGFAFTTEGTGVTRVVQIARLWTIESFDRPHNDILTIDLVAAERTDYSKANLFRT